MNFQNISLNKIKLARNSRLIHSNEDLSELMSSITQNGLLQPIGVIESKSRGTYEICYGNRRFLAMSKLGKSEIPCVVHESVDETDFDIKNLTENIQRRNVSLPELGRYIENLRKTLSTKEIAVRLGVPATFVKNCMDAYQTVPEKFREHLQVRNGAKLEGKIPIRVANRIINAKKTYALPAESVNSLFEAARKSDGFIPENIDRYAKELRAGRKDFLKTVKPLKQWVCRFVLAEEDFEYLKERYVEKGPYKTMQSLMEAIVTRQCAVRIPVLSRDLMKHAPVKKKRNSSASV